MLASGTVVKALITIITVIVVIVVGQQLLAGPLHSVLNVLNINTTNPDSRSTLTYEGVAKMTYSSFLRDVGYFIQSDKQVSVIPFDVSRNLVFSSQNRAYCIVGTRDSTKDIVSFSLKQGSSLDNCRRSGKVIESNSSITIDKKKVDFKSLKYLYDWNEGYEKFPIPDATGQDLSGSYNSFFFPDKSSGKSWVVLVRNPIIYSLTGNIEHFNKRFQYPCIADQNFLESYEITSTPNSKYHPFTGLNGSAIFGISELEADNLLSKDLNYDGSGDLYTCVMQKTNRLESGDNDHNWDFVGHKWKIDPYYLHYLGVSLDGHVVSNLKDDSTTIHNSQFLYTRSFASGAICNRLKIYSTLTYPNCSQIYDTLAADKNVISKMVSNFRTYFSSLSKSGTAFYPVTNIFTLSSVLSKESSFVTDFFDSGVADLLSCDQETLSPESYVPIEGNHPIPMISNFSYSLSIKSGRDSLEVNPTPNTNYFTLKNVNLKVPSLGKLELESWNSSSNKLVKVKSVVVPYKHSFQRPTSGNMNYQFFTNYNLFGSTNLLDGSSESCLEKTNSLKLITLPLIDTQKNVITCNSDWFKDYIIKKYNSKYVDFLTKVYALSKFQGINSNNFLENIIGPNGYESLASYYSTKRASDPFSYQICSDVDSKNKEIVSDIQKVYGPIASKIKNDMYDLYNSQNKMLGVIDLSGLQDFCGSGSTGSVWQQYYPNDNVYLCIGKYNGNSVAVKAIVAAKDSHPCDSSFLTAYNILTGSTSVGDIYYNVLNHPVNFYPNSKMFLTVYSQFNNQISTSQSGLEIDPCSLTYSDQKYKGDFPLLLVTRYNKIILPHLRNNNNKQIYLPYCLANSSTDVNVVLMSNEIPPGWYDTQIMDHPNDLFYYTLLDNNHDYKIGSESYSDFENTWIYNNMRGPVSNSEDPDTGNPDSYRTCNYLETKYNGH